MGAEKMFCLRRKRALLLDLSVYPLSYVICKAGLFSKYKTFLLSTWHNEINRGWLDNLFFPMLFKIWLETEFWPESDPDRSEELKKLCMGGVSGRNWAQFYDDIPLDFSGPFGCLDFAKAHPFFNEIAEVILASKEALLLLQVGSSSGREVAYFAEKFPKHVFIGTDIYASVIEFARSKHILDNLEFVVKPAHFISDLLERENRPVVLFSSGSLQYVHPLHVDLFFKRASALSKLRFYILEPSSELKCNPLALEGSMPRGNFSWVHNYKYYAEKYGISTKKAELIRPYLSIKHDPVRKATVHYYYSGSTLDRS